jgi:hypothetical protein
VSRSSAGFQNLWVDPLAVIPNTYSKLILVVADFHFDVAGDSVVESISDRLA